MDVREGEIVAVIGRNGVGKSTLMRTLIGLLPPTEGSIVFRGRDVSSLVAHRRARLGIGYVPQGRDVFPRMSVEENLKVGEMAGRKVEPEDYRRVYGTFPILAERRAQQAGTLSGGQQQQLAIGRVMISNPSLILLDEPSEGIQPSIVQDIARTIVELNRQTDVTIVFVEQNLDMIRAMAQRCYVMDKGRIVAALTPADLDDREVVRRHLAAMSREFNQQEGNIIMSWLETSIMARRGLAKGKSGTTYTITEESQGQYHYVYGPFAKPVLKVVPGSVISAETHDAFEGKIKFETDKPSEILNFPFLNPQNGPIYINGAEKGDTLAVYIKSIVPRGPQPVGTTCLIREFGGLVATGDTALLNPPLPERVKKVEVTLEGGVKWSDKLTLPYQPFIGTIGTSPEIEAITSLQPDYYGGNMDLPDVGVDAVIYLPVNAPGALLYLGDCHAIQGDGELCGVALEHPTVTTVQVDLIKKWTFKWPRLENEKFFMTIGSSRPMEDAARIAYRELIRHGRRFRFRRA